MEVPCCGYCGAECYGTCGDPDTCGSCWCDKYFEYDIDDGGDALGDCLDINCNCTCHKEVYEELEIRFEAGVMIHGELDGPPYERKGVFRFLAVSTVRAILTLPWSSSHLKYSAKA